MSHLVKVDVTIKDLDALAAAAQSLGLELRLGQRQYKWFGRSVGDYPLPDGITKDQLGKCDHALSVVGNKRAYEIGLVAQPDGTYSMLWDFWQGGYGLQARVGKDCRQLIERYTMEAAKRACEQLGWMTEETADGLTVYHPDGGTLQVTASDVEAFGFSGSGCQSAVDSLAAAIGRPVNAQHKPEFYENRQAVNEIESRQ